MYISSDTNIWIDFQEINHLDHPFRLEYEFCLSENAFNDELLKSDALREELLAKGLIISKVKEDEFSQAITLEKKYRRLSFYYRVALAIAKNRKWILLTGDKNLREAADKESVECHGVIWIYDKLKEAEKLSPDEYLSAIDDLISAVNKGRCRLPIDELRKRQGNGA